MPDKKDFKLKPRQTVNIESRSEETIARFSKWVHNQSNVSSSILSLVEHCIDRFGYVDVLEYEIAKKLYTEQLYFSDESSTYQKNIPVKNEIEESVIEPNSSEIKKVETESITEEKNEKNIGNTNKESFSNSINLKSF